MAGRCLYMKTDGGSRPPGLGRFSPVPRGCASRARSRPRPKTVHAQETQGVLRHCIGTCSGNSRSTELQPPMHATLPEWETTLDGASRSRSACGYLLSRVCIPETRALGEASSRFSCRAALPAYGYPTRAALARGAMLGASGAWPDADRTPDRELTKQISLTLAITALSAPNGQERAHLHGRAAS